MNDAANEKVMNAEMTVNGKRVYICYEAEDYYLVSYNADGSKQFKADKMKS